MQLIDAMRTTLLRKFFGDDGEDIKVYVLTQGVYDEEEVMGVHLTLEGAMGKSGEGEWRKNESRAEWQSREGYWYIEERVLEN